jgi:hypothetical protein
LRAVPFNDNADETAIFMPAPSGSAVEMVTIDPLDLQDVQDQDAGTLSMRDEMALRQEEHDECRDHSSRHSFITGNVVRLSKRFPARKAAPGPYHVVAQLPERDGQLQYRIKSGCEPFYRTVKENELV